VGHLEITHEGAIDVKRARKYVVKHMKDKFFDRINIWKIYLIFRLMLCKFR